MTVQGKSKFMEGGTKLGFPLDCHILFQFESAAVLTKAINQSI